MCIYVYTYIHVDYTKTLLRDSLGMCDYLKIQLRGLLRVYASIIELQ